MIEWLGDLWNFRGDGDLVAKLQGEIDRLEAELDQQGKLLKGTLDRLQALDVHTDALLNNYFGEEVEVDNMDKMQMQFGLYFLNSGLASQLPASDLYYFKKAFQQALWKSYQLGARDKAETAAKYPL